MDAKYISGKKVKATIGISDQTLRRLADKNKINFIKSVTGKRFYDIDSIISVHNKKTTQKDKIRKKICYCRVSSKKQDNDLQRQIKSMQSKYPDHEVYTDIGSGINWKRKSFSKLLSESYNGIIEEIIIAHQDRLSRFAFGLLENIFKLHGTKLIVLNKSKYQSPEQELSEDLLSIIHIFNCKQMGRRRYKSIEGDNINTNKKNKNISNDSSSEADE